MIELYDVGRVLVKEFKEGYDFIASKHGEKYIIDKNVLKNIREFHKDRKNKQLSQEEFNQLNQAWINGYKDNLLSINPEELVFPDVQLRFDSLKREGHKIVLLTSVSSELTRILLGENVSYDSIIVGETLGDKNNPSTYINIWRRFGNNINSYFDDKISCLDAALEGWRNVRINPKLYLVDRYGMYNKYEILDHFKGNVIYIKDLSEVK